MISLQDLKEYLTQLYPSEGILDFGPNGLQVEGKAKIQKVATAVSASGEAIEAAHQWGADALVVHHGLYWKNQWACIVGGMHRKVKALIDAEMSLFGYHLPMDAHQTVGNNWPAAHDLGLKELEPFGQHSGIEIGVRGRMSSVAVGDWVAKLEEYYGHKAHAALGGPPEIKKVAILSGGGNKFLSEAVQCGADCFVTGNHDEAQWHVAHDEGIHYVALGHHATEKVGPKLLATQIAKRFSIETQFINTDNPF